MNHKRQHYILLALALVLLLGLSNTIVSAQGNGPSPGISYQGRVTVNGQPFDGTGYFKFAVVDNQGQYTWTSDGPVSAQSVGQLGPPTQPIILPVHNGLFNVRLGDPLLMNLLFPPAFLDPQSSLRVWFSSDGGSFTQLPDRPIASVPHAMIADTLGGYDANHFAPASHNHWGETWSGSGTGLTLSSSNGIGVYGIMGAKSGQSSLGAGVWGDSADKPGVWGTSNAASGVVGFSTDNIGVGGISTNDSGVMGSSNNGAGVKGSAPVTGTVGLATNSSGNTYGVFGRSDSTEGVGVYGIANASSGVTAGVYGKSNSSTDYATAGRFVATGISGKTYGIDVTNKSTADDAAAGHFSADGASGATYGIDVENKSNDIGAAAGRFRATGTNGKTNGIYVENKSTTFNATAGYFTATGTSGATNGIYVENKSIGTWAVAGYFEAAGTSGVTYGIDVVNQSTGDNAAAGYFAADGASGATYGIDVKNKSTTNDATAGRFEATGTSGKTYGIDVANSSTTDDATAGRFKAAGTSGKTIGIYAENNSATDFAAAGRFVTTAGTGATYGIIAKSTSTKGVGVYGYSKGGAGGVGGKFVSYSGNLIEGWEEETPGGGAAWLRFKVDYNGNVYADGTYSSPAADFAELLPAATGLQPGDVLAIGPDGKLVRSSSRYQRSVVGVYSTRPGYLGGSTGDAAGKIPLAVVGVVPVKVSAENGPIHPGDLLVASSTPGHAMRAGANPPQGSVIGKALAGLASGEGVIQMLATLQ